MPVRMNGGRRGRGRRGPVCLVAACLGVAALGGGVARGDGAFPGSSGLMTPAVRPHDIVVGTNFGLVSSIDDGQTWTYSCEQELTAFGLNYQLGAPPLSRLFAISPLGLVFSDSRGCSWEVAGGLVTGTTVTDAFPDPTNSNRILAIANSTAGDGGTGPVGKIYESVDGGRTFPAVRYTAASGDNLTGVEISRSMPSVVYLTLISNMVPKLARSSDGGATWQFRDIATSLGVASRSIRLIAVDPDDANRVFLRVGVAVGDRLALSEDGGATADTVLDLGGGILSAFTRMADGTLVTTGVMGVSPVAYRSTDAGRTFQPLPAPPNLVGLSSRAGDLFGLTDTMLEDYALAISTDRGQTWRPLMSYTDVQAIDTCAKPQCQDDCRMRADMAQWSADLCDATPMPRPVDGGVPAADAGGGGAGGPAGGTMDGGRDASSADGGKAGTEKAGCGCSAGRAGAGGAWSLVLVIVIAAGAARTRTRRRG